MSAARRPCLAPPGPLPERTPDEEIMRALVILLPKLPAEVRREILLFARFLEDRVATGRYGTRTQ